MSEQIRIIEEAKILNLTDALQKIKRAEWDDFKKDHFMRLLVFYRKKNGQSKQMWSKDAWLTITVEMNTKFQGSNFSTQQLKQLERDLKKTYRSMKDVMRKHGLRFDEQMCTIEAPPDVWRKVFQVDSKAKKWHGKIVPYYANLDMLYRDGETMANGNHLTYAATSANGVPDQTLNSSTFNHAQPIHTEEHYNLHSSVQRNCLAELNPGSFQYPQVPSECNEPSFQYPQFGDWGAPSLVDLINSTSSPQMPPSTTFGGNEPSQVQDRMSACQFNDQFHQSHAQHVLTSTNINPTNHAAEFARRPNLNGASSSSCPTLYQCITEYNNMPGFDANDAYHVVEILKDSYYREVFFGYHGNNRSGWLKGVILTRVQQQ